MYKSLMYGHNQENVLPYLVITATLHAKIIAPVIALVLAETLLKFALERLSKHLTWYIHNNKMGWTSKTQMDKKI